MLEKQQAFQVHHYLKKTSRLSIPEKLVLADQTPEKYQN